ncbi:TRAP transporter small permease subunit [Azospirillum sp. ST 5-10]|uniref:TRAP transporter small permease subunit n=1 Tax=unclassified Azospirillum TaxID=2630922 RepID=UPI003F4A6594
MKARNASGFPQARIHQGGVAALVDTLERACRRLAHAMVVASGWGMLVLGLLVTADVLLRKFVGTNIGGVDEISGYLFAIGISWSLASAFHARSHVRIDVLYGRMPGWPRAFLDVLSVVSLLLLSLFLVFSSWLVLATSWELSSRSASSLQVPLAVPQAVWLFGMVVFALSLAVASVKAVLACAAGDRAAVIRDYGVSTASEEAEEAVHHSLGAK